MSDAIAALEAELPTQDVTDLVTEILASSLLSLGLLADGIHTMAALALQKPPAPYYERWLSSSILYLQQEHVLSAGLTLDREIRPLPALWAEWETKQAAWATNENLRAQSALFEVCLKALPGILSGKLRATDVMFPGSSMQLVEGIYRGNALAEHFNSILADTLTACIEEQLEAEPGQKIRLLEIGAGTGGTTAALLPRLQQYPIEEYCYTDVSKAFLMYAEKQFKPQFPALTTTLFDVSKPLSAQGITAASYDFAIAANVLHATPDIRETLRNAKAALKNQGVLLLNEISSWSLFNHLTFGLLEGWWLNEDTSLRLPGSPGLAPETWQEILAQEGFEDIVFPAVDAHRLGQQIVAARSDGWVRQRMAPVAPQPSVDAKRPESAAGSQPGAALPEQVERIRQIIITNLSDSLKLDAAVIRNDAPFAEYGVDSIIGVNLVRTINETLQIELETISLFEHTTVDQLAEHIATNWRQQIAGPVVSSPAQASAPPAMTTPRPVAVEHRFLSGELAAAPPQPEARPGNFGFEPIAIIGMSGRFAESESLDAFWENLERGKDLIGEVTRWQAADCVISGSDGESYCSRGSFIDTFDRFDPAFFRITATEAVYMEPQQRLFLEECWKALEDAGYGGKGVQETQCGVYVGCAGASNYASLFTEEPPAHAFWGNSDSIIPARIAYSLNLQGPAIAVDTACSSSLVSLHLACQGLWSGEMDMALAGGVCLHSTPVFYHVANRARMLSPDGTCYSFDARANGFVPGEGVGVVVLKRLRDAVRDGDTIQGVIAGSGINQDGASNGLIAPNARAQERLERSVYDRFKIDPETIQVIEAHGTGTPLGDSIEYGAITRAFREYTDKKQFCAIGTVKTNIGHTGGAAGVAGILKMLLALKHRQIPPSLHFEQGNPAINFDSSPFYVNTELKEWTIEGDAKRRGAVSSFGFSGTNAHVVIEEAPQVERASIESPGYLVVLSAQSAAQLQQQARNLLAMLKHSPDVSLNDVSFTLFVGRMHLSHRLSCVARSPEELMQRLEQWLDGAAAAQFYAGEIQQNRTRESVALKKFGNYCVQECRNATSPEGYLENLTALADLYVQGYALDYDALFSHESRRIPLPTYPFARERYWVDSVPVAARPAVARPLAVATASLSGGEDLAERLQNELSQMVMDALRLSADDFYADRVLMDLGFDSITLTKFAETINSAYHVDITPVMFFDYPSVEAIAKYLAVEHEDAVRQAGRNAAPVAAPPPQPPRTSFRRLAPARSAANDLVAIVGISGVMPQSDDLDALWANLTGGKEMISVIPADRWKWEDYYGDPLTEPNKSNSKWGAFMNEVDKFDPLFFGISPREAMMMDPQQRIFLETVWKAIEDSGQKVSELSGTKTGVFVGVSANDYTDVLRGQSVAIDGYLAPGNIHSVLANRISFLLNLHGPSAPVDTACSSSLVALHRAIESIHAGSSEMAIVGGVQVMLSPIPYVAFGVAGVLSSDGKCKTFDKRANGYVRGEGCGAIFLKPLSRAEADGNHIYAVVRASAENHGGRVTTLTAPNSVAQCALLVEAYEKAGIDPETVGYIECHGTGTTLGDPIEVQALNNAFAELYKRHDKAPAAVPHCGLGSVKTNIGHLETAAGIAGVLTVLLAMKHKQIPATANFEELNPFIRLEGTPFYIADRLAPWAAPAGPDGAPLPRRAGVSSFGLGGSNAHVVLEEYVPRQRASSAAEEGPYLIVLSARNADRLDAYIGSLQAFLDKPDLSLADVAYTLQVGRDELPERLAVVVSDKSELRQKLREILDGGSPQDSYRNHVKRNAAISKTAAGTAQEAIEDLIARKALAGIGEHWASGAKIDWASLYDAATPRRISVPTYPFARERHWVPNADAGVAASARLQSLVPVWNPARVDAVTRAVTADSTRILLLDGNPAHLDWVRRDFPDVRFVNLNAHTSIEVIAEELRASDPEHLLWIAPDVDDKPSLAHDEQGVLGVFRIVKALLAAGFASRKLQWTVITSRTQQVRKNELVQPAYAGVAGLLGSVAKEYPHWELRLLDIDSLASLAPRECLSVPADKQGNVLAHRGGQWFEQALEPFTAPARTKPAYRQNGVYVVIGGAGGVGELWSRSVIEHYQANVIWIGRRACDSVIEQKIAAISKSGRAPLYISADAADADSLEAAFQTIRQTHPVIHGVVHSAVVLRDQSIARMDESAFLSGYAAKADISVNLDRVFGAQELDFMLFFSSLVSFVKTPGQCNYAAGCTFEDAFAQKLQHERGYPVRIMNWGYWGGVGVAANETYTKRMAQIGLGSIEPLEGMAALETLVGSDVPQMVCVKTLVTAATAGLSLSEAMVLLSSKKAAPRAAGAAAPSGDPIRDYVGRVMIDKVSEALSLDPAEIGSDTPLNEYGVDSISGVILVRAINDALQIEVEPSKLLDYRTVDELAEYIAANWREHLKEQMTEQIAALSADPAIAPVQEVNAIANVIAGAAERLLLKETAETEMSGEQALESVLWQDVPAADGYEKVTF